MKQISEIIKLWIHKDSKQLYAEETQLEQLKIHIPNFPSLSFLQITPEYPIGNSSHYPFRIALYYTKNIDERAIERHFFQSRLVGGVKNKGCEFSPIIHILQDENNNERAIFFEQTYLKKHPYIPRFRAIADSSIWNYFLTKDSDFDLFVDEIYENYQKCYYNLRVAEEYADLNARLTANAELYVNPLGKEANGHAKDVSAFLFHSERKLLRKLQESDVQESIKNIKKYKWRFLLVDDHANVKMSSADEKLPIPTKLSIIESNFVGLFQLEEKENPIGALREFIQIDCVSNIQQAKKALKEKKYEIILLDYLLGDNGGREYGYQLLKSIKNTLDPGDEEITDENEKPFEFKLGPDNRFYFMFISAFTTAVSERLLAEGWARSEDYWYIGEGACTVNTPYLFQYRLLHIMQKRMKDMGLAKFDIKKQEEKKKPFACLLKTIHETFTKEVVEEHNNIYTELIKEIYSSKDEARQRANEKFQDVLDLLYHYKSLIKDTHITANWFDSNESVLATEFIKKHMNYEGVLEHLTQLVYLTAFGTVRQWPEMWEEYQYIKSVLGKIEEVEIYIVDLKNNSAK